MNHLRESSSPYLRQHADNPVDWWPWSEAAFAEARRRNVPVLVSIGYSTCHWCHVMAHESFEDAATAALMNERFVCIKVDREEHPEVDEIFMDAVQAMTGHGGWPLNAFTDHAGRPFYALTYLPRDRWTSLCVELARLWSDDRPRLDRVALDVVAHLETPAPQPGALDAGIWRLILDQSAQTFDPAHPGFAFNAERQPKFPSSQLLPLLLDLGGVGAGHCVATLEAMQDAGIHDRVGGGFHRYSVTRDWRLPHFEKMLYDNAQLMAVYARAGRQLGRTDFLQTAINTGDYLLRDLRITDHGRFHGYAAAEDADDPGGEGSFYAWSPQQVSDVLGLDAPAIIAAWDLAPGEPEVGPHGHVDPVVSHIPQPRGAGTPTPAQRAAWEPLLPRLREARAARPRPGRDDKVLTDLNGLALEGFAALARFADARFVGATAELADALAVRHPAEGLRRLTDRPAFITDYGHLVAGLTAAFAALGDPTLIDRAAAIADEAITHLRAEDGGFFTTPAGRVDLCRRSREAADNAYPAGQNSLALGLARLWQITGNARWKAIADGIIASSADFARRAPTACCTLLSAWRLLTRGPLVAVIAGGADDPRTAGLLTACRAWSRDDLAIVPLATCREQPWHCLDGRAALREPLVLICTADACLAPAGNADEVTARLRSLR